MPVKLVTPHPALSKKRQAPSWLYLLLVAALFWGCVPQPQKTAEQETADFVAEHSKGAIDGSSQAKKADSAAPNQLPLRYQRPAYFASKEEAGIGATAGAHVAVPVGAKITPTGPKPLRLVMQELAKLKSMNISWANDVDQEALVHVTIMPEEDFFEAIANVLRQRDYFHEVEGNTLIVKHKETKKFHIAMPFTSSSYSTSVGGDVLGNAQGGTGGASAGAITGTLNLTSTENKFDIWTNIQTNLDKILQIWSTPPPTLAAAPAAPGAQPAQAAGGAGAAAAPPGAPASANDSGRSGLGYYTIDRPIGLITVTAPRSLLGKIEAYLNNLKGEIYRQVAIEAKIIEVTLTGDNTTGLNWDILSSKIGVHVNLQSFTVSQGGTLNTDRNATLLSLSPNNFDVMIDAIKEQGHVEVLSNPKVSVMNGQPAMISVGENVTYVKSVSSTTESQTGTVSYTVTPASVMSGLGMGVIATVMDNDEIVLSLTPVTSSLTQPIEYKTFGSNQIGLPKVSLREMNTMVRVKSGEMLVVGGLIDTSAAYDDKYVAGLGKLPGIGKLFRTDGTVSQKKELIILMRPQLITM